MRTCMGLLSLLVFCGATVVAQGSTSSKEARQLEKATDVVNEIMQAPDKGIPSDLLQKSRVRGCSPV